MAHHAPAVDPDALRRGIGDLAGKLKLPLLAVGFIGLLAAALSSSRTVMRR